MIIKKDAIAIGKAIVEGMVREIDNNHNTRDAMYMLRGCAMYQLDNLWYDVLTAKCREQFEYDKELFYTLCGWPT